MSFFRGTSRILSFALGIVASAIFLAAVAYTAATKLGGYRAMPVLSGSMEPTMKTGSVAFVRPVPAKTVRKGDVVTFQQPDAPKGTYITHRVQKLERTDRGVIYTTRGDANNLADPWRLKAVGTVGKLEFDVPYAGYAIVYLGLRDVRIAIFLALMAAFLVMALVAIWRRPDDDAEAPGETAGGLTGISPEPVHIALSEALVGSHGGDETDVESDEHVLRSARFIVDTATKAKVEA